MAFIGPDPVEVVALLAALRERRRLARERSVQPLVLASDALTELDHMLVDGRISRLRHDELRREVVEILTGEEAEERQPWAEAVRPPPSEEDV